MKNTCNNAEGSQDHEDQPTQVVAGKKPTRKSQLGDVATVYEAMYSSFYDKTHQVVAIREWVGLVSTLERLSYHEAELSIVDLGCGSGRYLVPLARWLNRKGIKANLVAYDILDSVLRRVKTHLELSGLKPDQIASNVFNIGSVKVTVKIGSEVDTIESVERIKSEFGRQHIVFSFLSFMSHLSTSEMRLQLLLAVRSLLIDGGVFIASLPNVRHTWLKAQTRGEDDLPTSFGKGDVYIDPFARWQNTGYAKKYKLYCHAFSLSEIYALLEASSLSLADKIHAAKCCAGYKHLEISRKSQITNLEDAIASSLLSGERVDFDAFDFLLITQKSGGPTQLQTHRRGCSSVKRTQLLDVLKNQSNSLTDISEDDANYLADGYETVTWQAAYLHEIFPENEAA